MGWRVNNRKCTQHDMHYCKCKSHKRTHSTNQILQLCVQSVPKCWLVEEMAYFLVDQQHCLLMKVMYLPSGSSHSGRPENIPCDNQTRKSCWSSLEFLDHEQRRESKGLARFFSFLKFCRRGLSHLFVIARVSFKLNNFLSRFRCNPKNNKNI